MPSKYEVETENIVERKEKGKASSNVIKTIKMCKEMIKVFEFRAKGTS